MDLQIDIGIFLKKIKNNTIYSTNRRQRSEFGAEVFVVDADEKASLEIVGRGLTHAARVMLIRDGDVCGMHGVPLEVWGLNK